MDAPRFIPLALLFLLASACAPSATPTPLPPTPDVEAIETRIAGNIFATQTASVPTATATPTATDTPTDTVTATKTDTSLPTGTLSNQNAYYHAKPDGDRGCSEATSDCGHNGMHTRRDNCAF